MAHQQRFVKIRGEAFGAAMLDELRCAQCMVNRRWLLVTSEELETRM